MSVDRGSSRIFRRAEVDSTGGPDVEEIVMFFVGEDGAPVGGPGEPVEPRPPLAERLGIAPTDPPIPDIDQTKANLVPGMRPGQGVDAPRRTGFHEEILVTLHADPTDSIQTALTSDALAAAAPRLRVDGDSLMARRNELRWTASLRTMLWRRRRAHLRVYGSPSANVTVLTLSPLKPRKVATRSFLRRGMGAMTVLRDDLDEKLKRTAEAGVWEVSGEGGGLDEPTRRPDP